MRLELTHSQARDLAETLGLDVEGLDFESMSRSVDEMKQRADAAALRRAVREGQTARARLDEIERAEDRLYHEWSEFAGFPVEEREKLDELSIEDRAYAELSARTGTR